MSIAKRWRPTSSRFTIIATVTPHGIQTSLLRGTMDTGEENTDKELGTEGVWWVNSLSKGMAAG
jgi:hypothetical protein